MVLKNMMSAKTVFTLTVSILALSACQTTEVSQGASEEPVVSTTIKVKTTPLKNESYENPSDDPFVFNRM